MFAVLVAVTDVDFAALKAVVRLADPDPYLCESQVSTFTLECVKELLDLKEHWLQELWVVFDDSGVFDQTALAIVHVRFSYQNIWRSWAEEEEEEYDYFVRGVEPRLRLHYDILEDQVPSGLIVDYQNLLTRASLVAQWLRICLLMQGTRVRALVWEDPTCCVATRPVSHNY